ncbi:hypothetical protein C6503_21815 [Candidatus Poribacteria bacterium]|nr:MAG: hypothetical protein C6503_21815 [Candidatus Poribacteria bacterium]
MKIVARLCIALMSVILTFASDAQIQGGPKVQGPWLWCIAPTSLNEVEFGGAAAALSGLDFLSRRSDGEVTEEVIATEGAVIGDAVGDTFWTYGLITTESDNINDMLIATGVADGDINNHVAYGSILIDSSEEQETLMFAGSDDAVKVWLNGEIVHENFVDRGSYDYQDVFRVTLKEGENVLLVAVYERGGAWTGFFGFETGIEYEILPPRGLTVDVNSDGKINKTDLILVLNAIAVPVKSPGEDVNKDGDVKVAESEDVNEDGDVKVAENADANEDGDVNIAERVDVNKDGVVNIADLQHVIDYLDDPVAGAAPSLQNIISSPSPKGKLVTTWARLKSLE